MFVSHVLERVSVRMDDRDFLCMQHMIKTNEGPAFLGMPILRIYSKIAILCIGYY